MMKLLKRLWAGPTTLIGLAVTLLGAKRAVLWQPAGVDVGQIEYIAEGWLKAQMKRMRIGGITLGEVIIYQWQSAAWLQLHEIEHVRQAQRWGPLFLPAYGIASLWSWARGTGIYKGNAFEVAARKADGR